MIRFFKPLLISLCLGAAGLASGCATDQPAPSRPPPHPILRPPMVGGPCTYDDHAGTYTVIKVDPSGTGYAVHFSFWPDGARGVDRDVVNPNSGYVGQAAAPAPLLGQHFLGVWRQETHGTCTPSVYSVTINGAEVMLEPAH